MKKIAVLGALLLPLFSFAQVATYPANFDRFMALTTGLGSQSIGFASNGSPVPTTAFAGTGAHVGNLGVFPDAVAGSKGLEVRGGASLSVGSAGVKVPVTAVGKVSAASLGKAFGALASLAGGPVGLVAAFAIPFTLDWMAAAKVQANADNSFSRADPALCTVAPCYKYSSSRTSGYFNSPGAIGTAIVAATKVDAFPGWYYASCTGVLVGSAMNCTTDTGGVEGVPVTSTSRPPDTAVYIPATLAEVQSNLAAVQPNAFVLSELYNKAVIDNLIDINIVAAGPATVAGPVTTVNTPAVGATPASVTTTATNYNCTYVMAVTSCNETKTITKDGVVTATSAEPAKTPDPTPSDSATDTPLPGLPVLYTAKFPNGLTGVWADRKTQLTSTPLFSLVNQLMPSIAVTGTCPHWNLPLDLGPWNYGTQDVAPPCWVWDFAKAIVILSALLLARALIFGG